jgi:hypothetical protein
MLAYRPPLETPEDPKGEMEQGVHAVARDEVKVGLWA